MDTLAPHCYIDGHYFTGDELKDFKVERKITLSNGTVAKIPHCKTCKWDAEKAEKHMHELWEVEVGLSNTLTKAHLKEMKKLKIKRKHA